MPEVANPPTTTTNSSSGTNPNTITSGPIGTCDHSCFGCGLPIKDQFFYATLPDIKWHENCLKCAKCECRLKENSTCFVRNGKAYCKDDYINLFPVAKCNRCQLPIKRTDLVFKMASNSKVYHFECFACQICSRRFQPGDEYQVVDEMVYCKDDAQIALTNSSSLSAHHYHQPAPPHHQLYLNQMNLMTNSTISLTPENSIHSGTSSSASFSPNTNSSSSSIVDSPSNSSSNYSNNFQSNTSFTSYSSSNYVAGGLMVSQPHVFGSQLGPVYSNLQPGFGVDGNNNNNSLVKDGEHESNRERNERDENSDSDDDQVDDEDEDEDNDVGSEEETASSLNESVNSNTGVTNRSNQQKSAKKSSPIFTNLNKPITNKQTPHQRPYPNHHHLLQPKSNSGGHHHSKPARIRTVLNEKQLHTLRACYGANPRPDALMKEQLVEMTGLNPRVIRVWFQNKRCKDKKKNMLVGSSSGNPNPPLPQLQSLTNQNPKIEPQSHLQQQQLLRANLNQAPAQSTYNHLSYQPHMTSMFESSGGGCY